MNYVLYHSKCYDGFGAAYAAWKRFGDIETKYIAVSYGAPLPEMPFAKKIFIVDFSYKREVLLDLAKNSKVVVLDHHKTAHDELAPMIGGENPEVHFRMDQSGALMAWNYFHPEKPAPALIQHISDRDLWEFKLEGTARIHKALVSLPMNFRLWETLDIEVLKSEGTVCERIYTQLVENIVESSWMGEVDGHKVPIVNTSIAWSEVGHELNKKHPEAPFAASFTVFNNQVMWSLRSQGEFDVSAVAKKFGGGGHKNAAGFKTARF